MGSGRFDDILNNLPEKSPRSRLEPYRELIDELRRRGRTLREIAAILAEKCGVTVTHAGVHHFLRQQAMAAGKAPTRRLSVATTSDTRQRIEILKSQRPPANKVPALFQFDPTEPLNVGKGRNSKSR